MGTRNIAYGVKAVVAYGLPPYLHGPTVIKSVSVNLLEPRRPVQACIGIALPVPVATILCVQFQYLTG